MNNATFDIKNITDFLKTIVEYKTIIKYINNIVNNGLKCVGSIR